jgi:hypothetical protein
MRYLVIRSPRIADDRTRSKERYYVVLIRLGVDTDEFIGDDVEAGLSSTSRFAAKTPSVGIGRTMASNHQMNE